MPMKPALALACAILWTAATEGPSRAAAASTTAPPLVFGAPEAASPAGQGEHRAADADLAALRYFARQNDRGRVAAEIRLLRAKDPGFKPPDDLFSAPEAAVDQQPVWDLLARHDLAAAHAAIEALHRGKPGWQPSRDLLAAMARADGHDALVRASDGRDWGKVIEVASANPALLTCGDIDGVWRTAEALSRTGDEPHALLAYRYVLSACSSPEQRLATAQKASQAIRSPEALEALLRMGHRGPDGRGEFDEVRLGLLRRKVGEAAAGSAPNQPTADEIATLSAHADGPAGQGDAQLLGWFFYARHDAGGAEKWFRTALKAGDDAKAAEGLVLALRDAGRTAEALAAAIRYAALDMSNRKLLVEIEEARLGGPRAEALRPGELVLLARSIDQLKSSDAAQALGWALYKGDHLAGAERLFLKSAGWRSNESAAIGLVLSARRLHHERDYAARVARYRTLFPRIAAMETLMRAHPVAVPVALAVRRGHDPAVRTAGRRPPPVPPTGDTWDASATEIAKAYGDGRYELAVSLLEQRRRTRAEPHGLSVIRGWAMYHKGDWEGARQVFSSLDGAAEGREGMRVIEQSYTPRFR